MKVAAYCRVSTGEEAQLDSLKNQKIFFQEYVEKNGYELYNLYADEGISGVKLKKRDSFLQLMEDAKLGNFQKVFVKDVSRFARNTVDFLQSVRALKSLGVEVVFLTANMTSLGDSEFILTIFGALAQEESSNLSKRVKFGKQITAQKGRVPRQIFGYDRIDNYTLVINPTEAITIQKIFDLYTDKGYGCRAISIELNTQGHKTKQGCEWNPRTVRRVLKNQTYSGHYFNRKYEIADFMEGKLVSLPPEEHLHHERPEWAIISEEQFERAQKQLEERSVKYQNKEVFRGARYSSKHVFSTLIKCEHCGRTFCRKTYTYANTRIYWTCTTNDQYTAKYCDNNITINEGDLLDQIKEYFNSVIDDKAAFKAAVLENAYKSKDNLIAFNPQAEDAIRKQKAILTGRIAKLQELFLNDMISIDEIKSKTQSINTELDLINSRLADFTDEESQKNDFDIFVENYSDTVERFLNMESVTNLDMREIVDKISVNRDGEVTIHLKNYTAK